LANLLGLDVLVLCGVLLLLQLLVKAFLLLSGASVGLVDDLFILEQLFEL
jgi:hypothetical protein